MNGDAVEALCRRDEILQVMYWLRGERLGETVTAADLQRFLGDDVPVLEADLAALADTGFIEAADGDRGCFRLTRRGVEEGGRRFTDEFAEMQRPGHGQCNRPGCLCHQFGPESCVAYAERPA